MNAIDKRQSTRESTRERLLFEELHQRRVLNARRMAARRAAVRATKLALPVLAVGLLTLLVLWPELARLADQGRRGLKSLFAIEAESGRMLQPRYRGVDARGRPYAITADWASQTGQSRVDLGEPRGDVVLENGSWLQAQSQRGVFIQHSELLDMQDDVVLYRDDGITLHTQSAAVDIRQGAASSNTQTHAEGPFGTLDAQGFSTVEKGSVIQFQGPARLVLNEGHK